MVTNRRQRLRSSAPTPTTDSVLYSSFLWGYVRETLAATGASENNVAGLYT